MSGSLDPMGATMRAVVLYGREDARLERVPVPGVGPGEVRVRIGVALTCGTDLKVFRRGYHAKMIVPPAIFGHELAGTIDAVGPGVEDWRVGDRVVAANSAPCGACFYCGIDREELCEDLLFLNGAYAEYVTIPERIVRRNLLRVPDGLPLEAAAMVEPLACAVHGVAETGVRAGETVAILGAGPLGLLLARCAVLRGARVLVLGRRPERLAVAGLLGVEGVYEVTAVGGEPCPSYDYDDDDDDGQPIPNTQHRVPCGWPNTQHPMTPHLTREWLLSHTSGRGADRVIEAVGRPEAWTAAISLARKGGTVNLFGGCPAGTSMALDTGRLHYEALTLVGTFHHTPATIREALRLLAEEQVQAAALIQDRAPLDELPELLPRLAAGGGPLKVAVTPASSPRDGLVDYGRGV